MFLSVLSVCMPFMSVCLTCPVCFICLSCLTVSPACLFHLSVCLFNPNPDSVTCQSCQSVSPVLVYLTYVNLSVCLPVCLTCAVCPPVSPVLSVSLFHLSVVSVGLTGPSVLSVYPSCLSVLSHLSVCMLAFLSEDNVFFSQFSINCQLVHVQLVGVLFLFLLYCLADRIRLEQSTNTDTAEADSSEHRCVPKLLVLSENAKGWVLLTLRLLPLLRLKTSAECGNGPCCFLYVIKKKG